MPAVVGAKNRTVVSAENPSSCIRFQRDRFMRIALNLCEGSVAGNHSVLLTQTRPDVKAPSPEFFDILPQKTPRQIEQPSDSHLPPLFARRNWCQQLPTITATTEFLLNEDFFANFHELLDGGLKSAIRGRISISNRRHPNWSGFFVGPFAHQAHHL